jgi:hypothetical protein
MRKLIVCLLILVTYGCVQKQDTTVEIADSAKISRVFQSYPEINQVWISTPKTEIDGVTEKSLVFKRKIGEDGESFEFELNRKVEQSLDNVNKERVVIKFDDGKTLSYSKNSSGMISMVIDGYTLKGILMGSFNKNKDLINCLKNKRVKSFSIEGFDTVVTTTEADTFLKDFNTVLIMK